MLPGSHIMHYVTHNSSLSVIECIIWDYNTKYCQHQQLNYNINTTWLYFNNYFINILISGPKSDQCHKGVTILGWPCSLLAPNSHKIWPKKMKIALRKVLISIFSLRFFENQNTWNTTLVSYLTENPKMLQLRKSFICIQAWSGKTASMSKHETTPLMCRELRKY